MNQPINTIVARREKLITISTSCVVDQYAHVGDCKICLSRFYLTNPERGKMQFVSTVSVNLPGQNVQLKFSTVSTQFSSYKLQNLNNLQNEPIIIKKLYVGTSEDQAAYTTHYSIHMNRKPLNLLHKERLMDRTDTN